MNRTVGYDSWFVPDTLLRASPRRHTGGMDPSSDDPVETVRRWEAAGAVWRVLAAGSGGLTIGLFTCDGSEEMSRFTSDDPGLRQLVAGRTDPVG